MSASDPGDMPTTGGTSVIDLLRRSMRELTPSERRIVRELLADYPAAGLATAAQLAALASTSSATVIRLVQKLGFDGFLDFQSSLRYELSARRTGPIELLKRSESDWQGSGILKRTADASAIMVQSAATTVPELEFEAAVELLANKKRHIHLMGGRVTHVLAEYLELHLSRLRRGVTLIPQHGSERSAALLDMTGSDVLVAFDFKRYERETVDTTRLASQRGVRVVLITDVLMSPIAAHASIVLPVKVEMASPFDSAIVGVVVVEALALGTLVALGDAGLERMQAWDTLTAQGLVGS